MRLPVAVRVVGQILRTEWCSLLLTLLCGLVILIVTATLLWQHCQDMWSLLVANHRLVPAVFIALVVFAVEAHGFTERVLLTVHSARRLAEKCKPVVTKTRAVLFWQTKRAQVRVRYFARKLRPQRG
jgi:hypothetical protein